MESNPEAKPPRRQPRQPYSIDWGKHGMGPTAPEADDAAAAAAAEFPLDAAEAAAAACRTI